MKTIVVGYDETEASRRALERACQLARAFEARLVVTSVAGLLVPSGRGTGGIDPVDSLEFHEEQLAHAKTFVDAQGLVAAYAPAAGDPARTIVEVAGREHADLIVVGTREPRLLDRILNPSVSQGVARRSHCDVLIVH